jgi:antitoxin FitA
MISTLLSEFAASGDRTRRAQERARQALDCYPQWNHNGFNLVLGTAMPTTLTLKNIPDEVYVRLKASAESHRRSLNSEAIVCLESVLLPGRATAEEIIARARAIRDSLPKGKFTAKDIDAFKREGRP